MLYPKIGIRPVIDGRCAELFSTQNVTATLTVTPCWCYGSETMDLDPKTLKAVWGFNGTEDAQAADYAACKVYGPLYG